MEVAGSADAGNLAAVYHSPNLEWREKIQLAVDAIAGYYGSSLLGSMPMKLSRGSQSRLTWTSASLATRIRPTGPTLCW